MPRIDAHVHAFPDRLALAVRARLSERSPLRAGPLLPEVAQKVREEGFDGAWVLPYAHRPGVAESANEWMASEGPKYSWLVPGATFHPGDEDLAELVERALVEQGLRVVKLHCSVGQFSPGDPRLEPLWQVGEARRVPVVVHAGQRTPGETAADEIDELRPVLESHPGLPLVLAHAGHPSSAHAIELMHEYENLYADLTPVWDQPVVLEPAAIERFAGRLLFGSDSPNNPLDAGEQARRFEGMGLSAEALAMLMGGAAGRLVAVEG